MKSKVGINKETLFFLGLSLILSAPSGSPGAVTSRARDQGINSRKVHLEQNEFYCIREIWK